MGPSSRRAARIGALALAVAAAGCAPGGAVPPDGTVAPPAPPAPPTPLVPPARLSIATARAGPLSVELLADRPLGTGLAALSLRITSAGDALVTDAGVTLAAWRPSTGGAALAAPVLGPPAPGPDGGYAVEVVLPEGSTGADGWSVRVGVARPGEAEATAAFDGLAVVDRQLARRFGADPPRYLLAVRFEAALVAGPNPVTVSLHETADLGATWTPVEDATFAVEPWMPSMGHGSSGSVAPAPEGAPGRYRGSLAFSMAGDWETTFVVRRAGAEIGRPVVAVFF